MPAEQGEAAGQGGPGGEEVVHVTRQQHRAGVVLPAGGDLLGGERQPRAPAGLVPGVQQPAGGLDDGAPAVQQHEPPQVLAGPGRRRQEPLQARVQRLGLEVDG